MSVTRGENDDNSRPCGPAWARALCLAALGLAANAGANTSNGYNLPLGVTSLSRDIYALHMEVFWVCVGIAVAVFGVMIYALVKFRSSQGAIPDTNMVHSTKVDRLDHYSSRDPGGYGDPGREGDPHDGGHAQLRIVDPGHRLSMEVAVPIHGRGRGDQLLLDPGTRLEFRAPATFGNRSCDRAQLPLGSR